MLAKMHSHQRDGRQTRREARERTRDPVWMMTDPLAILVIGPPYSGMFTFLLFKEAYFLLSRYCNNLVAQPVGRTSQAVKGFEAYSRLVPRVMVAFGYLSGKYRSDS